MTDMTISNKSIPENYTVTCASGRQQNLKDLTVMFNRVQPKDNWKNPISCQLILQNPEKEIPFIKDAVAWFAGCETAVDYTHNSTQTRPIVWVSACGYYIAVGP
jgi:hypothetical protein